MSIALSHLNGFYVSGVSDQTHRDDGLPLRGSPILRGREDEAPV
jgi:hypothetical protein